MPISSIARIGFKRLTFLLVLISGLTAAGTVSAAQSLIVYGLSKDVAFVKIGGKDAVLRKGKKHLSGYELVEATSQSAQIAYQGEVATYKVTREIATSFSSRPPAARKHTVRIDANGQYLTMGRINKRTARMLIDTGANRVVLSEQHANALGLDYQNGRRTQSVTAGGRVDAWSIELAEVTLGPITLRQVSAIVNEGSHPTEILLGMSFLDQLKIEQRNGVISLER